jgi:hypothetical protein
MSYVPITARQALEWAKEDVSEAAMLLDTPVTGNYTINADLVTAILDRWIRRVEDTKPTKPGVTYRDGGPLGTIATKVRDE